MLTRKEFINKINKNSVPDHLINLDFYNNNAPDETEIKREIQANFPFLLNNEQLSLFKSEIDWGFMEDEEDYVGWRFRSEVNLNLIYDQILKNLPDEPDDLVTIYRIETKDGEGIYSYGEVASLLSPGIAPWEEPNLSIIFNKSIFNDYMRQWSFAFKNKDQMKKWLKSEKYETFDQAGILLKEIKINKYKIEEGSEQVVFRKENISSQKNITFRDLFNFDKKTAFKL